MTTQPAVLEPELTHQEVVARLRPYLQRHPIGNTVLEVIDGALRRDEDWWYVAVRLNAEEPRTYQYYDLLTDIEDEVAQQEHLKVLLVPAE